jgi:hypothetical protein
MYMDQLNACDNPSEQSDMPHSVTVPFDSSKKYIHLLPRTSGTQKKKRSYFGSSYEHALRMFKGHQPVTAKEDQWWVVGGGKSNEEPAAVTALFLAMKMVSGGKKYKFSVFQEWRAGHGGYLAFERKV